jgi:beta-galactosidase
LYIFKEVNLQTIHSSEIYGAEVQYFRLDPKYWGKILQEFKDAGLRTVTTYVQWSTHLVGLPDAAHPAGVLDFEGRTDPRLNLLYFLELVEKHGLNLNFRCGPFCCNEMVHGGYPEWLVMGDPGIMVWDYQNRTTQGYWIGKKEGSQPSYLHPEYLSWCAKWIAEVDKIIVPHLKSNGGCITMVNLDNEISYIIQDGFLSSDYNPVNVSRGGLYHQFLIQKYGSASKLPYPVAYASIEDVPAPRSVPEEISDDLAYYTDWCDFKTWVMAEYIRRLRGMHEANGVTDVLFMTNFNPHRPDGIPTRMPAFEEATGGITGYDFYRGTFMSYSGYHSMARILKLMNATLRYTWSAEFMSGTWNKILPTRVSDDHMRFMTRCALAHGCKAISWFMFHDRDCWGDAPVSSHGHPRTNLEVLREICDLVSNKVKDWDALIPQADIGIIYELVQHQHTYLGDPCPCADNEMHIGRPFINNIESGKTSLEYEGLFRLVEESGCQAGIIDILHSPLRLNDYPLALLPGSPVVSRTASGSLREYVERGGVLTVSGPWPMLDETGSPIEFLSIKNPCAGKEGMALGRGRVIWSCRYLAQNNPEEEDLNSLHFMRTLIDSYVPDPSVRINLIKEVSWVDWQNAGTEHAIYRQPRNLGSAVLQKGPGEALLFLMNHYPEAAEFEVQLADTGWRRMINLFSGKAIDFANGKALVDLDRKSAEIFLLKTS